MHAERTIAHLLPWPAIGGTEQATLRIAQSVRDKGFRSVAFCLEGADEVRTLFSDAGFRTRTYEPVLPSVRRPARFLYNSKRLIQQFREERVDLLHCADVEGTFYAGLAGRLARLPVLCHVRNPFETLTRRERAMIAPAHKFAFVSRDTWDRFPLKVEPHRGRVVYDGIATRPPSDPLVRAEVRQELGLPADVPIVGMLARVSPQKDFVTLGRAAQCVIREIPDAKFVVVGDFDSQKAYREHFAFVRGELARLGVLDSFVFTGFRSDVPRVLQAFDVFVLSTHFEGLPLVVLEAMAAGLPVVATAVNGIPEVISDDTLGLLYAHEDQFALGEHLLKLVRDPTLRRRIGHAGRARVMEAFGTEAFASNVAAMYRTMIPTRELP